MNGVSGSARVRKVKVGVVDIHDGARGGVKDWKGEQAIVAKRTAAAVPTVCMYHIVLVRVPAKKTLWYRTIRLYNSATVSYSTVQQV